MAFDSVPWIIDGTTVDAEVIRRALGTLIASSGGLVSAGDLAVTQQATPNMSVLMGTGQIWVPGSSSTSQGLYYGRNGAALTLAIAAANATNPRIEQVIVQVIDAEYVGGTVKSMAPTVITGTATAGASLTNLVGLGTVPASSMVIARVLVPAAATSIVTADIATVVGVAGNLSGRLLARQFYAPAAEATYTIATGGVSSSTAQILDGTNLTITFVAPSSGAVIVRLQATASCVAGAYQVWYLTTHGTTSVQGTPQNVLGGGGTTSPVEGVQTADFLVTGLTPGTSYQYDWSATSTATSGVYAGPGTATHNFGAAVMEVFAA